MTRKILVICFLVLFSVMRANGQDGKNGTNEFRFTTSYNFGLKKGIGGMLNFNPEFGHYFSNQLFLGIGSGVSVDDKFNSVSIPLFAHAEVNFPSKGITLYISLKAGYDFATGDNGSYARINPSFGVKVPLSGKTDLSLGCGYTRTIVDGGGADFMGFNVGLNFDTRGRGLSNFVKKLVYSADIETYTPFSYSDSDGGYRYEAKLSNLYGIRFNILAPVFDNLYVGPSLGVGRFTEQHKDSYGKYSDGTSEEYCKFMLRVKYELKQLTLANKFYPFAQADCGVADFSGFDELYFSINPSAGFAYSTTEHSAIYLSVGYSTIKQYGNSKGDLRIAIGYQF